jgi:cell division protein FtsQ
VDDDERADAPDDGDDLDLDLRSRKDQDELPADVLALLGGDDPEDLRGPAVDPDATPPEPVLTRDQIELLLGEATGSPVPGIVRIDDAVTARPSGRSSPASPAPSSSPSTPATPGGPSVDPRIRARRLDVLRAEGRRRLRLGLALAAVVLVVAAAYGVTRSPLLSVSDIRVTGAERTDPADLEAVLASVRGSSMVWIDLDGLRQRLEALPWVKRASVVRSWPRGLDIDLGERRPVAIYAGDDGAWRVLDADGRVVVTSTGRPVGFPEIIGDATAVDRGQVVPDRLAAAAALAAVLPPELSPTLAAIRLDPVSGLVLELVPKSYVVIGTADDLRGKLLRALTVLDRCPAGSFQVMDAQVSPVTLSPASACPALTRAGA